MRGDDHQEADAAQAIKPRAIGVAAVLLKTEFGLAAGLGQTEQPWQAIA